jgi:adenine-specific DNA-methyltransferase
VKQGATEDGIVLDFFARSGSTAQAVVQQNRQDGGNRKSVLVQLPEPTGRSDYPTIADVTKERMRRVFKKVNDVKVGRLDLECSTCQDLGFRVFKLAESNFTPWNAQAQRDTLAL